MSGSDLGSSKEGVIVSIDIKTTILHYKPLADRKQNMIRQMEKHGFTNYSFFTDYDGNELTNEDVRKYCGRMKDEPDRVREKTSIYERIIPNARSTLRELNMGEISLAVKYGKLFEQFASSDDEYFLLFEDDVVLCENFEHHFKNYLENTPSDWDVIYFGSGAGLTPQTIHGIPISPNKTSYLMSHPASRCTDSIIIKRKAAADLARTWFPFNLAADWEISYQHHLHNHQVYWWEPSLVRQGSEHGIFKSTLR